FSFQMVDREVVEAGRLDPTGFRANYSNSIEMESSDRRATRLHPSRQPTTAPTSSAAAAAEAEDELELKYGAEHVIRLFVPVSICMALVILTMKMSTFYSEPDKNGGLLYTPFHSSSDDQTSKRILYGLGNAFFMIVFIVIMTFLLILFYYYKCYKIIHGWLIMSSLMLLSMFSMVYVSQLMESRNWCVSMPTVLIGLLNYAAMGMICIHWKGPLLMQQGYLISVSALMALMFIKMLPDWTAWALLGLISIWDLIAVLCPKGPLNMLVKMSQERNEPIFPALIYSSGILLPYTIAMSMVGDGEREKMEEEGDGEEREGREGSDTNNSHPSTSSSVPSTAASTSVLIPSGEMRQKKPQVRRMPPPERVERGGHEGVERAERAEGRARGGGGNNAARRVDSGPRLEEEVEERGIKLGLGDFIFYSVLVGMASKSEDWNTIVACYVAILVGLCATLLLLAVFKKALPALPISIFAGLIFYFCTAFLITPFTTQLVTHQLTY
ncbi:hypothetical protein PENTCL1PPCAC_26259, partial [Pristionchus entomophagus]